MNRRDRASKAGRAVAWGVATRLLKRAPVVGAAFTIGLAGYDIKRKGLVKGALNVALNATPVVGAVKGVVEIFTGDFLADKPSDKPENVARARRNKRSKE